MTQTLWKLRAFYLATGLSGGILMPYLSLLFLHDGFSSSDVGMILASGTAVSILVQPIWGYFVDKTGMVRLTLIMSCVVPGLAAVLFNAHWLWFVTLASIISNVFSIPQAPIADTYAVATARQAGSSYGSIRMFASAGFALGGYCGGLFLQFSTVTVIWLPYLILCVLGAVAAITFPREGASLRVRVQTSLGEGLKYLMRDKRFVACLIGGFLLSQTLTAFNTYFAITFREIGGSMNLTGVAFLIASATNVPSMLVATRVMKRMGREPILILASLAYVIRWGVQAFVPIPSVSIAIQVLHGVSFGFYYVVAVDFVSHLAQKEFQATAQSVFGMICGGLAGVVGNLVNGLLLGAGGPKLMYIFCTISCALGAVCFWYIHHISKRDAPVSTVSGQSFVGGA